MEERKITTILGVCLAVCGLLLVLAIIYLVRWAYRRILRVGMLEDANYRLKLDNHRLDAYKSQNEQMKEELLLAYEKAGLGMGILGTLRQFGELAYAHQSAEIQAANADNYRKQMIIEQNARIEESNERTKLSDDLKRMHETVAESQRERERLELMIQGSGLEKYMQHHSSENAPKKLPRIVHKASNMLPESSENAPQELSKSLLEAQGGDLEDVRIFKLLNSDKRYYLRAETNLRKIWIVSKTSGEDIAWFDPNSIEKGVARKIRNGIFVLWCAAPGCNALKITKQPHAKACSPHHAKLIETIKRQKQAANG